MGNRRGVIELRILACIGFPDTTNMRKKLTLYCGVGLRCVLPMKSLQDLGSANSLP